MTDPGNPPTDTSTPATEGGRNERLGTILRRARERHELELSDVAEVTHVRRDYLRALEDGDYETLPEDVYARNFLRLFAQTVALDPAPLLDQFARERGRTDGRTTQTPTTAPSRSPGTPAAGSPADRSAGSGAASEAKRPRRAPAPGPSAGRVDARGFDLGRLASLLATLVVFAAVVAGAVWIFNANLFTAGRTPAAPTAEAPSLAPDPGAVSATDGAAGSEADVDAPATGLAAPVVPSPPQTDAGAEPGTAAPGAEPLAAAAPEILLTITTEPPGARVMVDNFVLPGRTPIVAERVTARPQRVVTVSRDGYATHEQAYDLSSDRSIDLVLTPLGEAGDAAAATPDAAEPAALGGAQIEIEVTGETWLEIYPSTARGEGQALVYSTVQAGERYVFSAPLFVRAGNAGGVQVRRGDGAAAPLGSTGEVVDRVFAP